jgi:transposase
VRDLSAGDTRIYLEIESRRVRCHRCGKAMQEKLSWLSNNPFYTERFVFFVGQRCRTSTIQYVARECAGLWPASWKLSVTFEKSPVIAASPNSMPRSALMTLHLIIASRPPK